MLAGRSVSIPTRTPFLSNKILFIFIYSVCTILPSLVIYLLECTVQDAVCTNKKKGLHSFCLSWLKMRFFLFQLGWFPPYFNVVNPFFYYDIHTYCGYSHNCGFSPIHNILKSILYFL